MTASLPAELAIRRAVGPAAFDRGRPYHLQGRVLQVIIDDSTIRGEVIGNSPVPYQVTATYGGDPVLLSGVCSCPMATNCKHVAAVALSALAASEAEHEQRSAGPMAPQQFENPDPSPGTPLVAYRALDRTRRVAGRAVEPAPPAVPDWRRTLGGMLEHAERQQPSADVAALGLQVEASVPRHHSLYHRDDTPPRLRLRPVTVGKRGDWVQKGAAWSDLEYSRYGRWSRHPGRDPLLALYSWLRGSHGYAQEPIYLDAAGSGIWPLLDDVIDAGVPLVFGRTGTGEVVREPVRIGVDVTNGDNANGSGSGDDGAVLLAPRLTGSGVPPEFDLNRAMTIGEPPIGLWSVTGPGTGHSDTAAGRGQHLLLWRFDRRLDTLTRRLLDLGSPVTIPHDDLPAFRTGYLPRLRDLTDVSSTDGTIELPTIHPPCPVLRVTCEDGHRTTVEWFVRYSSGDPVDSTEQWFGLDDPVSDNDFRVPSVGPAAGSENADDAGAIRNHRAEQRALDALDLSRPAFADVVERVGGRCRPAARQEFTGAATAEFHRQVLPALQNTGVTIEIIGDPLDYRDPDTDPVVEIRVEDSADRDWFNLAVTVVVDGYEVPFRALFHALATRNVLMLDNGICLDVDRPEFHRLRRLIEKSWEIADPESGQLRLSPVHAGLWDELVDFGVVREQSERWEASVAGLLDVTALPTPPPPDDFRADLRPYQLTGYHWLSFLAEHRLGGILADDMGLGKTVQALAAIQRSVDRGEQRPVLVVAPTSVVGNWAAEAARFTPGLSVAVVTGTAKRRGRSLADVADGADIVVTSYALLRLEFDAYAEIAWSAALFDEAQAVKNHQSKSYQCARRLPADIKVAITGTPLENNLMELWALLSIVAPGLFPDPKAFSEDYRRPIESGGDPELLATLRQRIRPLMLRRRKELVAADLPPKQEQVLGVELHPKHRRIYQTELQRVRQKVLGLLTDPEKNRFEILQGLTRLRQLALSAGLVDAEHADIPSAKIEALIGHLGELAAEGHRALVFSQFTRFLGQVQHRLDAEGIDHVYLDGRTTDRGQRVREFTEGTAPVFLISLKAGGFGLNLTEADYCFILDPWWNPAAEAQAVDRTHRIGQTKPVMVYRLIAADTIEEKVLQLQESKRDLFSRVIEDGGMLGKALSAADIRGLLS